MKKFIYMDDPSISLELLPSVLEIECKMFSTYLTCFDWYWMGTVSNRKITEMENDILLCEFTHDKNIRWVFQDDGTFVIKIQMKPCPNLIWTFHKGQWNVIHDGTFLYLDVTYDKTHHCQYRITQNETGIITMTRSTKSTYKFKGVATRILEQ